MYSDDESIKEIEISRPPLLIDVLTKIASKYFTDKSLQRFKKQWSEKIPHSPHEIAKWWITMERPAKQNESCQERHKNNKTIWHCPYIDHCSYTLEKFLRENSSMQELIIKGNLLGCYWRGDDRSDYESIINIYIKNKEQPGSVKLPSYRKLMENFVKRI